MNQPQKLKIKEAENVIDNPVNKEKILERLSAMSEDIMFVKKELENGSKDDHEKDKGRELEENMRRKIEEDLEKGLEEEMMRNDHTMRNFEFEEIKKK